MELRDYIEAGIREKNGVSALAEYLGLIPNNITNAKAHQRGLPAHACVKLSELLDVDLKAVIAASELVTERKEDKRAFWLPFVTNAPNLTQLAKFVLVIAIVTNFVTPYPAEAAPAANPTPERLCIM